MINTIGFDELTFAALKALGEAALAESDLEAPAARYRAAVAQRDLCRTWKAFAKALESLVEGVAILRGDRFGLMLHVDRDPAFTRRFGKRLKAIGGRYSDVRGHSRTRFVTIPAGEKGRALANEIARAFRVEVVIVRSRHERLLGMRSANTVFRSENYRKAPARAISHWTTKILKEHGRTIADVEKAQAIDR